jgi:3-deoxy-D-manno-octulosonic-acid transferase
MYLLYSALSVVALVIASPFLAYQAVRHRKYVRSLRQRLGYLPLSFNIDGDESIWIHAVSVGETLTARALIGELKTRYPGLKLFLSTTTMTGHEVARALTDVDGVFYFPLDWGFTVRRTLDVVRPRLFVMMETEIWPMLLRECRERGVATMLVNGRISKRSLARYTLVRRFFRRVLDDVERFCMQSEEAARRIVALGADPARVVVTGSLKFDSLDWPGVGPHGQSRDRVLRYRRAVPSSSPPARCGARIRRRSRPSAASRRAGRTRC